MKRVSEELAAEDAPDVECEKCGKKMVVRISKRGKFLGCPGFPSCRSTMPMPGSEDDDGGPSVEAEETDEKCDDCGKPMVVRRARRGRSKGSRFLACTGYPKCKGIKSYSMGLPCPKEGCDGTLVERASRGRIFYGCGKYPDCKEVVNKLPEGEGEAQPEVAPPAGPEGDSDTQPPEEGPAAESAPAE